MTFLEAKTLERAATSLECQDISYLKWTMLQTPWHHRLNNISIIKSMHGTKKFILRL